MIELRDYQTRMIDAVREAYRRRVRRVLLVAPTGSGKTVCFSSIATSAAQRGKRIAILVHRQELLDQVSDTLHRFEIGHGMIAAQYEPNPAAPVQVASVMTLVRRVPLTQPPDLLIIDECHHARSKSWETITDSMPNTRILGCTATPLAHGGGLGDAFDELICGPSAAELTTAGHLAPARVFAPPTISTDGMHTLMGDYLKSEVSAAVDKPIVTGDAIDHYQRLTPGLRAAVFCVSLEHAAHIAAAARASNIAAVTIDGSMDRHVRRRIIQDFQTGLIQWLVTVDLLSEGFDCPGIEVGIFLRPTQSLGLWLQQCGRVLRPSPGKTTAFLLDHAGNALRLGLPTDERQWSLKTGDVRRDSARAASIKVCPKCFHAQLGGKPACTECKTKFKIESRKVDHADGELQEITPEEIAKRRERSQIGMAAHSGDRARLEEIARIKGYAPGWIEHRLRAAQRKQQGKS